jgi:hypothetical protein
VGKTNKRAYVRRQHVAKYAGEKTKKFCSCCYEHYCASVRQGNTAGIRRTLLERRFQFALMDSWSRVRGEPGK